MYPFILIFLSLECTLNFVMSVSQLMSVKVSADFVFCCSNAVVVLEQDRSDYVLIPHSLFRVLLRGLEQSSPLLLVL